MIRSILHVLLNILAWYKILSSRTVKFQLYTYVFINTEFMNTPTPFPSQIKMTLQYLNQKKDKITLVFLRQWQKN